MSFLHVLFMSAPSLACLLILSVNLNIDFGTAGGIVDVIVNGIRTADRMAGDILMVLIFLILKAH